MKIEFCKEIKADNDTVWYTKRNGSYVSDSLRRNEEEARAIFEHLKTHSDVIGESILETYETDE